MKVNRSAKNQLLNCVQLLLIIFISAFHGEVNAQPEIKAVQLNDNLVLLPIYGVNTTIFKYGSEAMVIDAGYEQVAENLNAELVKMGIEKIKYLVNTHWHFDHVGGNKYFGNQSYVIAHSSVRELLSKDEMLLGELQNAYPEEALPEIIVDEEISLYMGNEEIKILPLTGAHSGGDILVWFKNSNVVHIGDIIFSDMFPFIDVDHGGSVITLADNLNKIVDMFPEDINIITGHGRMLTVGDVENYREMVIATTKIVKSELDSGKSLEEIIKNETLKDYNEWGKAFSCSDWIEMICKSIAQ